MLSPHSLCLYGKLSHLITGLLIFVSIYLVDFLFYWRKNLLIVLVESFVDRIVGLFIYFLDLVIDSDSDS